MQSGLVIGNEGPAIQVELEGGRVVQYRLRGRLRQKGKESNSVVIGDQVVVTEESGTASTNQIKPRRCALRRPRQHGGTQILAANIDQMIIVQSAR